MGTFKSICNLDIGGLDTLVTGLSQVKGVFTIVSGVRM